MNRIITISREFGSGGRELGRRLADALGYAYYDNEIVTAVAEKSGLAEQYVQSISENQFNTYPIHYGHTFAIAPVPENNYIRMLAAQRQFLREMAEKSSCVIVGRGADMILEEWKPLSIFVYADMASRVRRCREKATGEERDMSDRELEKMIRQIDGGRTRYRRMFSDQKWGAKEDHQLCLNTTDLEIRAIAPAVAEYARCWFENRDKREL